MRGPTKTRVRTLRTVHSGCRLDRIDYESTDRAQDRPNVECVFTDGDGNTLHETAKELTETVRPGQSVDLRFVLAVDVEEATRYVLPVRWVSD